MDKLSQLKKITAVVVDTGDIAQIQQYEPLDATTNPSLIFQASQTEAGQSLVQNAVSLAQRRVTDPKKRLQFAMENLAVSFGCEILSLIQGYVSTEVDARYSFDTQKTILAANRLIELYKKRGVDPKRVLIKIASTWEGIEAAKILEQQQVHCNLTLIFSMPQAMACAEAKAYLVSPFVGRILDWHKQHNPENLDQGDPGVLSVCQIYEYYKAYAYPTIVMGASFRSQPQIEQLAGCDRLTIAPKFLQSLQQDPGKLERALDPEKPQGTVQPKQVLDEATFRWNMNQNAMATEKLAEGIRLFSQDIVKLEQYLNPLLTA